MKRTIIVGDVHGCFDEFIELCEAMKVTFGEDRMILLGDLVHKGPSSAKVVNFVMEHKIESILGNHDHFFLKTLKGGQEPYREFTDILSQLVFNKNTLIEWFSNLPLFIESEQCLLVHGGLDPDGKAIKILNREILLNIRYWDLTNNTMLNSDGHSAVKSGCYPWYECLKFDNFQKKKIFYGHWAKKEVQMYGNGKIIGLDTGCCYGGKLSAYILEEERIVQVKSKQRKQFDY